MASWDRKSPVSVQEYRCLRIIKGKEFLLGMERGRAINGRLKRYPIDLVA
jgi:hypothetical protein